MRAKYKGILLKTSPFLGDAKILRVFTEEEGLLSFLAKSISKKKWSALTYALCIAEWSVEKKRGDLHLLKEGALIDPLLELQKNFETLFEALQIGQDLLKTQLPGKKEKALYPLTIAYLKQLPRFENPSILRLSFRLKLLAIEGLFSVATFDREEKQAVEALKELKRFSDLKTISLKEKTKEKIHLFFEKSF